MTIIGWSIYTRVTGADTLIAVNQSFLIGLLFIMIAASVVIYQTGFLNLLIKGFQDLRHMIMPKTRSLIRADKQIEKEKELKGDSAFTPFLKMLVISIGIGSIIYSIVLL
ncbi:DUF3899 domain-containing protein [Neobacillus sp. NPDC058068]|uniref:DUF3899 domain-containing protein n=1 Tax=Neobacillus sp. NPDC058068 TaxID=3346325 RepID=UPI0036DD893F